MVSVIYPPCQPLESEDWRCVHCAFLEVKCALNILFFHLYLSFALFLVFVVLFLYAT